MQGIDPFNRDNSWYQLAVRLRATDALSGALCVHFVADDGHQVDLGISISPAHQRQGHRLGAVLATLGSLFTTLNKHRHLDRALSCVVYLRCSEPRRIHVCFATAGSRERNMSLDAFLKIDDIQGESRDSVHKDEIAVLSWEWGMTQLGSSHSGSGSGAGKVAVHDLTINKHVDRASANLIKLCCSGKHFALATLVIRKAGSQPVEYLKIEMRDGIVSHVGVTGDPPDEHSYESVRLNFASFKYEYAPQTAKGTKDGANFAQWNIAKNSES